jgi:hypothetical protein
MNTADPLTAVRAAALFVSNLSASAHPSDADIEAAIRHSLRTRGGIRGCSADVAAAYGDYPELAAPRMRWARTVVENLYQRRLPAHLAQPALVMAAA